MKTQSAKAKGRRLQQQVVGDLLNTFPHLSNDDITSTSMGASGEDIKMSSAARQSIPFSFEAKNQERVNIWSSITQARTNTPRDATPAVIFKKNGEEPQVVVPWKAFLQLINPDSKNKQNIADLHEIGKRLQHIASELT